MEKYSSTKKYNQKLLKFEKGNPIDIKSKIKKSKYKIALGFAAEYKYAIQTPGFQDIYFMCNKIPKFHCDRFYYPNKNIIKEKIVLTQETNSFLVDKEILLFSLNYEGNYPKLLNLLTLSKIPIYSRERKNNFPILIAGGICPTYNPKVISGIFDIIIIGEADPTLKSVLNEYKNLKNKNKYSKFQFLKNISKTPGVYIPRLSQGPVNIIINKKIDNNIKSYIVSPFSKESNYLFLEITRGCDNYCTFCILCKVFKKQRNRKKKEVIKIIKNMRRYTNKMRFITPSDAYHPNILTFYETLEKLNYDIQMGSIKADTIDNKFEKVISLVKVPKLTIAPESASFEIRKKLKKPIEDKHIFNTIELAKKYKIPKIGLFFIIGFPSEKKEDKLQIIPLIKRIRISLDTDSFGKSIILEVTINSQIKKPNTIFEKDLQQDINEYYKDIKEIKNGLAGINNLKINSMDKDLLALECLLAKGKEEEFNLLYKIYKKKKSINIGYKDLYKSKLFNSKFKPKKG